MIVLKVLFGVLFGVLGAAAWARVSPSGGGVGGVWLFPVAGIAGVGASLLGAYLFSLVADPFVSAPIGGMIIGFLGGLAVAAIRGQFRKPPPSV